METERPTSALYANLFRVGHNDSEFVVDFCQSYGARSGADATALVARIVVTPAGAKELCELLRDSLDQHTQLIARGVSGARGP